MKLLTVAIPCYNSQDYMANAIDSVLIGGEEVEILVIDDGSSDDTLKIAKEYEAKHPGIVRAIHQENKGHGGAVNTGIANAAGAWFKVLDSDDRVDPDALVKVLNVLREFYRMRDVSVRLDMLITNYVYDKFCQDRRVVSYEHELPEDELFTWDDVKRFRKGEYMLMHAVIYRTELLRSCGLHLPEHTFYVDNIYVFEPLAKARFMYYLNVDFYYYFIGRDDQSVCETNMVKRQDQQLAVNRRMIDYFTANYDIISGNRHLEQYMYNYLEIVTSVTQVILIIDGSREALDKKRALLDYMYDAHPDTYHRYRYGFLGVGTNIPGRPGRYITKGGYKICRKYFKFN